MLLLLQHFGEYVLRQPHPPLPRFARWGTFPKGEGMDDLGPYYTTLARKKKVPF